jgi:hypothetical protein
MDRESFLDTIRSQYAEEINEAYLECEHENGRQIDVKKLNELLTKLMKTAKVDGLPPREFEDLVKSTLPKIVGMVDLSQLFKAA